MLFRSPSKLLAFILQKNTNEALQYLKKFEDKGGNGRWLTEELLSLLHMAVLTKSGIEDSFENRELLNSVSQKQLAVCIKKMLESYVLAKYSPVDILPLMIMVVEYCDQK